MVGADSSDDMPEFSLDIISGAGFYPPRNQEEFGTRLAHFLKGTLERGEIPVFGPRTAFDVLCTAAGIGIQQHELAEAYRRIAGPGVRTLVERDVGAPASFFSSLDELCNHKIPEPMLGEVRKDFADATVKRVLRGLAGLWSLEEAQSNLWLYRSSSQPSKQWSFEFPPGTVSVDDEQRLDSILLRMADSYVKQSLRPYLRTKASLAIHGITLLEERGLLDGDTKNALVNRAVQTFDSEQPANKEFQEEAAKLGAFDIVPYAGKVYNALIKAAARSNSGYNSELVETVRKLHARASIPGLSAIIMQAQAEEQKKGENSHYADELAKIVDPLVTSTTPTFDKEYAGKTLTLLIGDSLKAAHWAEAGSLVKAYRATWGALQESVAAKLQEASAKFLSTNLMQAYELAVAAAGSPKGVLPQPFTAAIDLRRENLFRPTMLLSGFDKADQYQSLAKAVVTLEQKFEGRLNGVKQEAEAAVDKAHTLLFSQLPNFPPEGQRMIMRQLAEALEYLDFLAFEYRVQTKTAPTSAIPPEIIDKLRNVMTQGYHVLGTLDRHTLPTYLNLHMHRVLERVAKDFGLPLEMRVQPAERPQQPAEHDERKELILKITDHAAQLRRDPWMHGSHMPRQQPTPAHPAQPAYTAAAVQAEVIATFGSTGLLQRKSVALLEVLAAAGEAWQKDHHSKAANALTPALKIALKTALDNEYGTLRQSRVVQRDRTQAALQRIEEAFGIYSGLMRRQSAQPASYPPSVPTQTPSAVQRQTEKYVTVYIGVMMPQTPEQQLRQQAVRLAQQYPIGDSKPEDRVVTGQFNLEGRIVKAVGVKLKPEQLEKDFRRLGRIFMVGADVDYKPEPSTRGKVHSVVQETATPQGTFYSLIFYQVQMPGNVVPIHPADISSVVSRTISLAKTTTTASQPPQTI